MGLFQKYRRRFQGLKLRLKEAVIHGWLGTMFSTSFRNYPEGFQAVRFVT